MLAQGRMTDEVHQPTEIPLKAPAQNLGPSQDAERWMMDLLQVHYANLYRLAFTMLSDTEQVRRVVIETFAAFSEHTHHHPRRPDPLWMYEYLLSHIRIRSKLPEPPASPSELDARIWLLVDKL